MGKRKHHGYGVVDLKDILSRVQDGRLTDDQRVQFFDRVVCEYAAQLQSCQKENTALSEEIAVLSKGVARRGAEIARLRARVDELVAERKRGSKRRGSNGHCGPKRRQHKDKYAINSTGVDSDSSSSATDDEVDYEAIDDSYRDENDENDENDA